MVEMEQIMWREGDLYRQRKEAEAAAKVDGVSSSFGSLALGPEAKRNKRYGAAAKVDRRGAAEDDDDGAEEGKTQGDMLRAMRARNGGAPSSRK